MEAAAARPRVVRCWVQRMGARARWIASDRVNTPVKAQTWASGCHVLFEGDRQGLLGYLRHTLDRPSVCRIMINALHHVAVDCHVQYHLHGPCSDRATLHCI